MPGWIRQLMKITEQLFNLQKPGLSRDSSSCCSRGLCWWLESHSPTDTNQWQPCKPCADGSFQEAGDKYICDNLCDKCKVAPILSLITDRTCDGEIIGKVVRHCQTSVKAKAKCHFIDSAAVSNRRCNRVHYAKEVQDGQFGSNSLTLERTSTLLIDRKCQWGNLWTTDQIRSFVQIKRSTSYTEIQDDTILFAKRSLEQGCFLLSGDIWG